MKSSYIWFLVQSTYNKDTLPIMFQELVVLPLISSYI